MAGQIEIITGPMFAGKTEELIRRLTRVQYAGQRAIVFKPEIDNRCQLPHPIEGGACKSSS